MSDRSVCFSVEEWTELCKSGVCPAVRITPAGDSMRPLIRKNRDAVVIVPFTRAPKVGDIVLFHRADGQYVVHRLRKMEKDRVVTLGDNCLSPDAPFSADALCGLVTEVKRDGRTVKTDTRRARLCGRVWMRLLPFRRGVRGLKRLVKGVVRRV